MDMSEELRQAAIEYQAADRAYFEALVQVPLADPSGDELLRKQEAANKLAHKVAKLVAQAMPA